MVEGIPARLTAGEGRRFGLTVGAAFLGLAGIAWWRAQHSLAAMLASPRVWGGRHTTAVALAVLGLFLVVAGLTIPTRVGPLQRAWMGFSHGLSKVTTPVFMAIVYFVVLTPIGWLMRVSGKTLLVDAPDDVSVWTTRAHRRGDMKRQF